MSVTAIANATSNKAMQELLGTIWDELAKIRKMLGCATGGSGAGMLVGSSTWDAGSIADGDAASKDITVTGAALGDFALASMGVDVVDLGVSVAITAADTVTVTLLNNTGGAVDLASTTARVVVIPLAAAAQALSAMVLSKT